MGIVHDALHENARRVNRVGIEFAGYHQHLNFSYRDSAAHGCGGIEVARRLTVDQVPVRIALPSLHQGQVSANPAFENVLVSVEFAMLLAFSHNRAYSGASVKAG